jgi:FKBP-type peptidyl-prolyl cis-trans isomerase
LEYVVRNYLITLAVTGTLFLTGCGGNQQATEPQPTVDLESLEGKVSYVLGYNNAAQLQSQGVQLDAEAFSAGVAAAVAGENSAIGEEEARAAFEEFQEQMMAEAQSSFDALAEENRAKSEAFLEENAQAEGVMTTDSGLQYKVLEMGDGEMPVAESTVQVHYEGRLIGGEVFDSSIERGEPVAFALNQVIPGWTEGLQLMPEGSRFELYIPSDLAYGPGGSQRIGPNEALIFEVELLDANYSEASEDSEG